MAYIKNRNEKGLNRNLNCDIAQQRNMRGKNS